MERELNTVQMYLLVHPNIYTHTYIAFAYAYLYNMHNTRKRFPPLACSLCHVWFHRKEPYDMIKHEFHSFSAFDSQLRHQYILIIGKKIFFLNTVE